MKKFTKALPDQTSVDLALWDIILKAEQCEGSMCKADKNIINNLLMFFKQQDSDFCTDFSILADIISVLESLLQESTLELASQLLQIVRRFEENK